MEIAQLLMSLVYAWGLDPEIDKICESKLGLLRPISPVSFGVISKGKFLFIYGNCFYYFQFDLIYFRFYEFTFTNVAK